MVVVSANIGSNKREQIEPVPAADCFLVRGKLFLHSASQWDQGQDAEDVEGHIIMMKISIQMHHEAQR